MSGDATVFDVTVAGAAPRRVRARSWWRALEAAVGAQALPPPGGWRLVVHDDGVELRGEDGLLVRIVERAEGHGRARVEVDPAMEHAEAARAALLQAHERVPCESGAILLLDRGYLRFTAAFGPRAAGLIGVRVSASTGVAGHVLTTLRGMVTDEQDPHHYDGLDEITGYRTSRILAVPIAHAGSTWGVLELLNPPAEHPFGAAELASVEQVCARLALLLSRA